VGVSGQKKATLINKTGVLSTKPSKIRASPCFREIRASTFGYTQGVSFKPSKPKIQ